MSRRAGWLRIGLMSSACLAAIAGAGIVLARSAVPVPETTSVGPLTLVVDRGAVAASPVVSESAAADAAVVLMRQKAHPLPHGYRLAAWGYHSGMTEVVDRATHRVLFAARPAENDYVLYFVAPPQLGFRTLSAVVAVDAGTATVSFFGQKFVP